MVQEGWEMVKKQNMTVCRPPARDVQQQLPAVTDGHSYGELLSAVGACLDKHEGLVLLRLIPGLRGEV